MSASKIHDLDFDQTILERIPEHVIEKLKEIRADNARKDTHKITHVHERMGSRLDMPVPHDLRGKRVRVTLEVVE